MRRREAAGVVLLEEDLSHCFTVSFFKAVISGETEEA